MPNKRNTYDEKNNSRKFRTSTMLMKAALNNENEHCDGPVLNPQILDETKDENTIPHLDESILSALSNTLNSNKVYGEDIHSEIIKRFETILTCGLKKDIKEEIVKRYLIPKNAKLLDAPKLNVELQSLLTDSVINRDTKLEQQQQQLGTTIAIIGDIMNNLRRGDVNIMNTITTLSDVIRLLSDLHWEDTITRRKLIASNLDENIAQSLEGSVRDSLLFGENYNKNVLTPNSTKKSGTAILKPSNINNGQKNKIQRNLPKQVSGNYQGSPCDSHYEEGDGEQSSAEDLDETWVAVSSSQTLPLHTEDCMSISKGPTSLTQQSYPGSLHLIIEGCRKRLVPEEDINVMISSLSDDTIKQYTVALTKWWVYCDGKDVFELSIPKVLKFLSENLNQGASYNTLITFRSALSLLLKSNLDNDSQVEQFFKDIDQVEPSITLDPSVILNYICNWFPNEYLDLDKLTKKSVTLLALGSELSIQTLSLISISDIEIVENGAKIKITNLSKTSAPENRQVYLFVPFYLPKPEICPVLTLKCYIEKTQNLRNLNTDDKLFISYIKPHNHVSIKTLIRWIKQVISDVDPTFAPREISLTTMFKSVGWSIGSTVFTE